MKKLVIVALISIFLASLIYYPIKSGFGQATPSANTMLDDEADVYDTAFEAKDFSRARRKPVIFFDKSVYCPDVEVFWNQNASLFSAKITITDHHIGARVIKVRVFSSLDTKKVSLTKITPGRFEGSVQANCLRYDEPVSDQAVFNVRYGDKIIAKYTDHVQAMAFVGFPKYVLDKTFTSLNPWKLFDSEGVPLVNYGWPIGVQYNPVTVSQYALATYHMYVTTGNSTFREAFLVQANWLVKNAEQKDSFSVWEYKFNWPDYKATSPWVSAMAQGQGMSVLTRAYALTGNMTYLEVAETAMHSFEVEMNSGGVRHTDQDGVWYEEVADVGAPSSKVLNGLIFALLGLFEYSFETNSSLGYALFWEGTYTLSSNLYRYDTGSWSYYDLLYYRPAPLSYHKLHVDQLEILYKLTGDSTFHVYSEKFSSYMR